MATLRAPSSLALQCVKRSSSRPFVLTKRSHDATYIRWHASSSSSSKSSVQPKLVPPTDTWTVYPKSFSIGTLAGICGSLAGMGGGFVMIPLMTSRLLQLSQHQAHGTSLFAVMATGFAGAISYGSHVEYESAIAVATCGMISARFGAQVTKFMSEQVLRQMLGILMLLMAPAIPLKTYVMDKYKTTPDQEIATASEDGTKPAGTTAPLSLMDDPSRLIAPSAIGLCSGFLAGVFGVGGGVIVVPALTVALNLNHYQALGTSLAAMTPPAAVGVYTHYTAGNVAMRVAPSLALGAFAGAYIGGQLGQHTDQTTLRWGFTGILTVLGLRTLIKA